jgi:hypothetical protein
MIPCQLQILYGIEWEMVGWLQAVNRERVAVSYVRVLSWLFHGGTKENQAEISS